MASWQLTMLLISGFCARWTHGLPFPDYMATVPYLKPIDKIDVAPISGAGSQRGSHWYDYNTSISDGSSEMPEGYSATSSISESDFGDTSEMSSAFASSKETTEKRMATRTNRECIACPLDMIMKHSNVGIKWICGMYQRARRSFKSLCMMRYRNCQDGTMFVKIGDHQCKDDPYHGHHWFYVYKV